jgi:hypothetical protein
MLKHTESTPPRPWINIKNKIKFSCCKTGALKISMKYITRNNCSSVTLWILLDLMVKDTHSSFFKKKIYHYSNSKPSCGKLFFLINHVIIITKKKKEFGIELDFTMLGPRLG